MNNLREELKEVLKMKSSAGGFHYVQKAQQLGRTAQKARQFSNLLRTPIGQWRKTLSDTRYVLDELAEMDISW